MGFLPTTSSVKPRFRRKNHGGKGYSSSPRYLLNTRRYIVVPNMSLRLAARTHIESSPESVTITGRESSERTSAISLSTLSVEKAGHSPNGRKGSFSTCHIFIAGEFLYRFITTSSYLRSASSCSFAESSSAHAGIWHSRQRRPFLPMTKT